MAPDAPVRVCPTPPKDDSETIAPSVRESLIATLREAAEDPALVGDLTLTRDVVALLSHLLSLAKATDND
jgi:hypothetical protein